MSRLALPSAAAIVLAGASGCGEQPVRVSIAAPRDDQTVRTSRVRVHGTVEPPDAEVRIDDRVAPVRGGAFDVTVRLHRGRNRIHVAATSSGLPSDISDLIVTNGRTRTELAEARRRSAARRAATGAAARKAERVTPGAGNRYPLVREACMDNCRVRAPIAACGCLLRYL